MDIWGRPRMEKNQLIIELGQLLKVNGYKKIGKGIWHKEMGEDFVLKFRVQSDRFEKGEYDLRVGVEVIVPGIKLKYPLYECIEGHFGTILPAENVQQVYEDANLFFEQWLDKKELKYKMQLLKEWRDRNSVEYLRSLPHGAGYEQPPFDVPIGENILYDYILSDEFKGDTNGKK